jgi:uncharacterized protein
MQIRKIINDPVHGFINITHALVFEIIGHPYFQRLRRIHQMALAHLVYPGAVHSRFHHALGAYHLMRQALHELKLRGNDITEEEELAAQIAILLHDIGHGPYSHALEGKLVNTHHETMSLLIMNELNKQLNGRLQMAIDIFTDKHPKKFLHQLVSGQLDVDRLDYLTRDSYFSGVSEGVIGYDRIIKMMVVHNGELMVEQKGIHSIEEFLISRRLMYWQVYLHKTVLAAEQMLIKIIERAKQINADMHSNLQFFFSNNIDYSNAELLKQFALIDDTDIMMAIKQWQLHSDVILSTLCTRLLNRNLFKIRVENNPITDDELNKKLQNCMATFNVSLADANYFVFSGAVENTTYKTEDDHIQILFKNGEVKDISEVDNAIIQKSVSGTVAKYYICYIQ